MNFLNLGDIADFQNGYAFSSKLYVAESNESKEVLRMGYIKRGGGFKEDDRKVFAPKESKGYVKKYMLEQDDIVIAMTDMKNDMKILGCCALVKHNSRFLLNQRVGRVRVRDTNLVNPKYLYYFLNSPDQIRDIRSRANSGVQVNLSTQSIKESLIKIYPIEYQNKIVEVLHNLDKKIELNQQMNENLEEIAKTLFKSWFIDFDPVRAKAEGRPTGLSKEISDLFPDSFEDSELGEMPSGWKVGNLGNLCVPKRGKVITKAKVEPGNFPVVAGGIKPPYYHSESNAESPIVTISASGTAGFVNLYYQDIWASDCSYINKEITDNVFFIYSFLKINQQRIYDLRHGAVQQHVYPKDLIELPIFLSSISNAIFFFRFIFSH